MIDADVSRLTGEHSAVPVVELTDGGGFGASRDLEISRELLGLVADAEPRRSLLRVYRPVPTVAFSRRESLMQGFAAASDSARAQGFTPVIRPTGGRAVSYNSSCLILDLVIPEGVRRLDSEGLFKSIAGQFAVTLRKLGVDAHVGEVPGEYCPGKFSVNARHSVKLIGASQRGIRGARLLSASIPVESDPQLVEVLTDVNRALGFSWQPSTFGCVASEAPGVGIDGLRRALLDDLAGSQRMSIPYHRVASSPLGERLSGE